MIESKKKAIGIFGGSFDPPHKGHLMISKISLKKLNLKKLYWIITKKNPFKKGAYFSLQDRVKKSTELVKSYKKIKVQFLEKKTKSNKSIKVIEHLRSKNKGCKIYLIIGEDNLIGFHRWTRWKEILDICELVIFSRKGYNKKAKKSAIVMHLKKSKTIFIKNKKIDVSSTEIRNLYKNKKI